MDPGKSLKEYVEDHTKSRLSKVESTLETENLLESGTQT